VPRRWAARYFLPASARPSSRWRRWPTWQPNGYVGTPSFLRILLEKADELGIKLPSLTKALVSGEAFLPPVRDALLARGIAGYQAYATAELGVIAYETEARQGLVVDEGVIVEIVRPGTGDPVAEGEVGEVVVTTFNSDYPLIRFGTGDLSAVLAGISPCGRSNMRIKGWMGRADQTTKIKGMFVHPRAGGCRGQAPSRRSSGRGWW
jgi:phenylacetate-CoA ligase